MKTIKEIKEDVAVNAGFKDWTDLIFSSGLMVLSYQQKVLDIANNQKNYVSKNKN